ncbi:MAG: biotin--[acetyl-CoA-carboxylase] ligase [Bacteroidia bacterium]|nr:biotin--[acetyl-CoA-carboxylase] ligase [Bacteroidia bacterium]
MKTKEMLKTLFTGQHMLRLENTASTNLAAWELLSKSRPEEGFAVLAQFQTRGRGQVGTQWESESGKNLLVSYILYPVFIEPKDLFILNKVVSLGVYDFVKHVLKKDVCIKWPNDIYYRSNKISGLLIENSVTFSDVNYSIVGIGLNVNQTKFNTHIPPATSIKLITKKKYDLEKCFNELSSFIEARYLQLKEKKLSDINNDYKKVLYRFREFCIFKKKQVSFKARIVDVMEDGKLLLENENGKFESFRFKEISFVMNCES